MHGSELIIFKADRAVEHGSMQIKIERKYKEAKEKRFKKKSFYKDLRQIERNLKEREKELQNE